MPKFSSFQFSSFQFWSTLSSKFPHVPPFRARSVGKVTKWCSRWGSLWQVALWPKTCPWDLLTKRRKKEIYCHITFTACGSNFCEPNFHEFRLKWWRKEICLHCGDELNGLGPSWMGLTHGNVIFDILEPSAFQKYSIGWVFQAFFTAVVYMCTIFAFNRFLINKYRLWANIRYDLTHMWCWSGLGIFHRKPISFFLSVFPLLEGTYFSTFPLVNNGERQRGC